MAVTRIGMKKAKISNSNRKQKSAIAKLLEKGKEERIKVEAIIRDDFLSEALEIVEMFLDLCVGRIALISESKECPEDMKEAICTLIYVAPRVGVQELLEIREQFEEKWGKKFVKNCGMNKDLSVNRKVMMKMSIKVPDPVLCINYLKAIANEFDVEWETNSEQVLQPYGVGQRQGIDKLQNSGVQQTNTNLKPVIQPPPNIIQPPNIIPQPIIPLVNETTPEIFQNVEKPKNEDQSSFDFDTLQKRFEDLKTNE